MMTGKAVHLLQMNNKYTVFKSLPECIICENIEYQINTDFRVWIEISEMLKDSKMSDTDKILCLLIKGYKSQIPQNINDAIDALIYFLSQGNTSSSSTTTPVISFLKDEGYIYAAFLGQYKIDLYEENLHWWKFLYLLNALDENTQFMKIVGYRCIKPENFSDKNKRNFYRKMKNKYSLNKFILDSDVANALEI